MQEVPLPSVKDKVRFASGRKSSFAMKFSRQTHVAISKRWLANWTE